MPTPKIPRRSPVRVLALGAALHLEACGARPTELTHNPPMPGTGAVPTPPPVPAAVEAPVSGAGGPSAIAEAEPGAPVIPEAEPGPPGRPPLGEPVMTRNPPPPPPPTTGLPRWDEVKSTHPEGATNPPAPVLIVQLDGARCWKGWRGGMIGPSPEERALGGRVVEVGAVVSDTEIQCPAERAAAVLDAHKRGLQR
jgi:hypothetical protein